MEGSAERLRHEHNSRMSLAWHVAALTRAKRLPKLGKLMAHGRGEAGRAEGPEAIAAALKQWAVQIEARAMAAGAAKAKRLAAMKKKSNRKKR